MASLSLAHPVAAVKPNISYVTITQYTWYIQKTQEMESSCYKITRNNSAQSQFPFPQIRVIYLRCSIVSQFNLFLASGSKYYLYTQVWQFYQQNRIFAKIYHRYVVNVAHFIHTSDKYPTKGNRRQCAVSRKFLRCKIIFVTYPLVQVGPKKKSRFWQAKCHVN